MNDAIYFEDDSSKIYHMKFNIPIKKVNNYEYFDGEKDFVRELVSL